MVEAARFRTALVEAYSRAHKLGAPLSVWWVDVDDCSQLNDRYGEANVDETLKVFERELSSIVAGCDGALLTRLSGQSWALALPGTNAADSHARAEKLRSAWAAMKELAVSVSVGVACRKPGEPALNLLEEAELACTRAKQAGRGQVILR
ncbi:MAG: GGDEF domain-containing protein [Myxococcaceae bacterium]